jgi:16S rRNA (cytosine1402-N4)-methyltransferase
MHQPVLYEAILSALSVRTDGIYLDATFGRGGHARGILQLLGDNGRLLACDRDTQALDYASEQELFQEPKCQLFHSDFAQMPDIVKRLGLMGRINGILLDLGVSSPQLDNPERGFSFQQDGPLDMRMDSGQPLDAAKWLSQAEETEISEVLWRYGEERYSRRIAKAIVSAREQEPIVTTAQLVALIEGAMPRRDKHKHPATRSFQAIRLYINDELGQLERFLAQTLGLLAPGGRLAVISFHSLEDRIVKQWMRDQASPPQMPSKLPVREDEFSPALRIITRKPRVADEREICHNPRARSAKLRVAEKSNDQPGSSACLQGQQA